MEKKFENEKKRIENAFKAKIDNFKELLKINDIIYNTYNTSKENYFHNINIINLLVNYYKKGNNIMKEMKNNEDFMETLKQREYELNKIQIEDSNYRKRDSSIDEKKISKQIFQNKMNYNKNTIKNINHQQLKSINKSNISIQSIYDNKTFSNTKSKENSNDIKSVEEKIDFKIFEEKNDNKSQNDLIHFQNIDNYSKD